jgi:hypothetical protein
MATANTAPAATTTVQLTVPRGRENCALWLRNNSPASVADILEATEQMCALSDVAAGRPAGAQLREVAQLRAELDTVLSSRERLREAHDAALTTLRDERDGLRDELQAARGGMAGERDKMQRECEARVGEVRKLLVDTYGSRLAQIQAALQEQTESLRRASVGKDPANAVDVKAVHDGLELGVLTPMGDDFVWNYTPADGRRRIQGLVTTARGGSVGSVDAFRSTMREGVAAGRLNLGVLLSLGARVPGRAHVAIASRAADDSLSAHTLVTLAFRTMSSMWSQLSAIGQPADATVHDMCTFLTAQLAEVQAMDAHIQGIEKGHELIAGQLVGLRTARDKLLDELGTFQRRHLPHEAIVVAPAAPSASLDGEAGRQCLAAIRSYHATKKRMPRGVDDLSDLLSQDLLAAARAGGLYDAARAAVVHENYASGARKRVRN